MIEYGAEAVDAEIRHDNTQFQYMDLQGVERRLDAKTPFPELVKCRLAWCGSRASRRHKNITQSTANPK